MFGWNKFRFQKILGPKTFCVHKYYGSKKIVVPKKFESEKYLSQKILGPPPSYGIGLSMVSWIGGSIPWL